MDGTVQPALVGKSGTGTLPAWRPEMEGAYTTSGSVPKTPPYLGHNTGRGFHEYSY